jgi:hypothetical protein
MLVQVKNYLYLKSDGQMVTNGDLFKGLEGVDCDSLFFILTQQPPMGHGLLIHAVSRSHTRTHHSR